jgi:hypothetical protein
MAHRVHAIWSLLPCLVVIVAPTPPAPSSCFNMVRRDERVRSLIMGTNSGYRDSKCDFNAELAIPRPLYCGFDRSWTNSSYSCWLMEDDDDADVILLFLICRNCFLFIFLIIVFFGNVSCDVGSEEWQRMSPRSGHDFFQVQVIVLYFHYAFIMLLLCFYYAFIMLLLCFHYAFIMLSLCFFRYEINKGFFFRR